MKRITFVASAVALVTGAIAGAVLARQTQATQPFFAGNRLGLPVNPAPDGAFEAISSNVKVYGSIYSAESCSYDAGRGLVVVPNRGVPQNVQTNNAWVSLLNHDGSVHTARWIGVQNPGDRGNLTPKLVLNEPNGSDIANGMLYLADRDGGGSPYWTRTASGRTRSTASARSLRATNRVRMVASKAQSRTFGGYRRVPQVQHTEGV